MASDVHATVDLNPLQAVEKSIDDLSNAYTAGDSVESEKGLDQFAHAVLTYMGIPRRDWPEPAIDGLFSDDRSRSQSRFVGACLLRLLAVNSDCFKVTSFRHKALQLIDREFAGDLYPRIGLTQKQQSHEKEHALRDVLPGALSSLAQATSALSKLESFTSLRTQFLRAYNNPIVQAVVVPFLASLDVPLMLKSLSDSIEVYLASSPTDFLSRYRDACRACESAINAILGRGGRYGERYVLPLVTAVKARLQESFDASPVHQAPSLSVSASDKKYPFYLKDERISLEFEVRNGGPGHAFDVQLAVFAITDVTAVSTVFTIGDLEATAIRVPMPVITHGSTSDIAVEVDLRWTTFDRSEREQRFTIGFQAQRSDIDWESLATSEPYDLEPVSTDSELIGRAEFLNELTAMVQPTSIGSALIYGQKRVGKTSIVKTLANRLERLSPGQFTIVYTELGDYVRPDPLRTIEALARRLCDEVKYLDSRFTSISIPALEGALAPVGDFLTAGHRHSPNRKFLFILDEFDMLPVDLYTRNELADAFFLSIRSLSAKPHIGFILVGSEKMQAILTFQGHQLNKFKALRVDYFDRNRNWGDFVDLVRRPSAEVLEFSDKAVNAIYDFTAGNPYFTKLICKSVFAEMVSRRDSHVTDREVIEAVNRELRRLEVNSFLHFWEDGIIEKGEGRRKISELRQKVLLAFTEVVRRNEVATVGALREAAKGYDISADQLQVELDDFEQRKVLTRSEAGYAIKVKLFSEWLKEAGPHALLPRLGERIATVERKREEEAYVRVEEIAPLTDRWRLYKGRSITAEDVRGWLNQFGSNVEQRLMFKLLQHIKWFSETQIRAHLATLHQTITREIGIKLAGKIPRVHDMLVSYLDGPGKSGAQYAKLYGEENKVYHENVVEPTRLGKIVQTDTSKKAIVLVDDFLGTGRSLIEHIKAHRLALSEIAALGRVQIFVAVIAGYRSAVDAVERDCGRSGLSIVVRTAEPLAESDRAFARGGAFSDNDERCAAKRIAERYGAHLDRKEPLGYGGSEALVVFERSCPNNTLPIIWASGQDWRPLFRRL